MAERLYSPPEIDIVSMIHWARNDGHFAEFLIEIILYEIATWTHDSDDLVPIDLFLASVHFSRAFMTAHGHDIDPTPRSGFGSKSEAEARVRAKYGIDTDSSTPGATTTGTGIGTSISDIIPYDLCIATAPYTLSTVDMGKYLEDKWRARRLFTREIRVLGCDCKLPRLSNQDHEHFRRQYAKIRPDFQDRFAAIIHHCRANVWAYLGSGGKSVKTHGLWRVEKLTSQYNLNLSNERRHASNTTPTTTTARGVDGIDHSSHNNNNNNNNGNNKSSQTSSSSSILPLTPASSPPLSKNGDVASVSTETSTTTAAAAAAAADADPTATVGEKSKSALKKAKRKAKKNVEPTQTRENADGEDNLLSSSSPSPPLLRLPLQPPSSSLPSSSPSPSSSSSPSPSLLSTLSTRNNNALPTTTPPPISVRSTLLPSLPLTPITTPTTTTAPYIYTTIYPSEDDKTLDKAVQMAIQSRNRLLHHLIGCRTHPGTAVNNPTTIGLCKEWKRLHQTALDSVSTAFNTAEIQRQAAVERARQKFVAVIQSWDDSFRIHYLCLLGQGINEAQSRIQIAVEKARQTTMRMMRMKEGGKEGKKLSMKQKKEQGRVAPSLEDKSLAELEKESGKSSRGKPNSTINGTSTEKKGLGIDSTKKNNNNSSSSSRSISNALNPAEQKAKETSLEKKDKKKKALEEDLQAFLDDFMNAQFIIPRGYESYFSKPCRANFGKVARIFIQQELDIHSHPLIIHLAIYIGKIFRDNVLPLQEIIRLFERAQNRAIKRYPKGDLDNPESELWAKKIFCLVTNDVWDHPGGMGELVYDLTGRPIYVNAAGTEIAHLDAFGLDDEEMYLARLREFYTNPDHYDDDDGEEIPDDLPGFESVIEDKADDNANTDEDLPRFESVSEKGDTTDEDRSGFETAAENQTDTDEDLPGFETATEQEETDDDLPEFEPVTEDEESTQKKREKDQRQAAELEDKHSKTAINFATFDFDSDDDSDDPDYICSGTDSDTDGYSLDASFSYDAQEEDDEQESLNAELRDLKKTANEQEGDDYDEQLLLHLMVMKSLRQGCVHDTLPKDLTTDEYEDKDVSEIEYEISTKEVKDLAIDERLLVHPEETKSLLQYLIHERQELLQNQWEVHSLQRHEDPDQAAIQWEDSLQRDLDHIAVAGLREKGRIVQYDQANTAKGWAERIAREESEQAVRAEKERIAREKAGQVAREEAVKAAIVEQQRIAREWAEQASREWAEQAAREKAERIAKAEAAKQAAGEDAERAAKAEEKRIARRWAELTAREAERAAKAEEERIVREWAEQAAREEVERIAKAEAAAQAARDEVARIAKAKADEQAAREEAKRAAKAEEERIARERIEQAAKEEAERAAKAEEERIAREKAEQTAREEADRATKAEEERIARERIEQAAREEAERAAKAEEERIVREKAEEAAREEAERAAKAEEGRIARERIEQAAREEAERAAKAEEERIARRKAEQVAKEGRMAKEKAARDAQRATKEAVGEVARGVRQAAKAKEERIAKEQAEKACISRNRAVRAAEDAKRAVQAQIERVAREKAENDRLRAEQAAEEAKRAVRAQIERIARGKAEAERIAREKAEQATKAEAERQAKEIAELIAKTEADRLAREEATRLKKEEDARMAKQEAETRVANKKEQEAHLLILEEDIRQAGKRVEDALQTKKEVAQEYRQQLEIQTQAERFKADRMDEIAAMRRDEQAKAEAQARSDAWKLGRSYGEKYDQAAKARKTIEERIERLKADRYEEIAETHLAAKASGEGNTAQAVEGLEEQFKKDMEVTNKELELANKACEEASKAQRNLQAQMHADEQCETKRIKDQAEARKQQEEMDKVKLKQADNEAAALAKSRGEPIRLANRGAVFFDWQGLNFTLSLWKQSGHWGSMESTLNQWFLGLLCSKGAYDTRCAFLGRLQQIFYTEFPGQGLELKPFGSFITGLGNDWSDLDICIYSADFQPNAPHSNVVYLAEFLRNCMMENVIEIPDAKVPIVRFVDPITHISCDMNIQHTLGIHNSSLIQTYLSIDPRLREFLIVLKYFAKCHGILDASLGYLNSYAYNLMGIVFFQEQREAILPRLQSKEARPRSYNTLGKSRKRMPDFGSCLDNGSIANQQVSEAGIIYDCSFDTRIDAYKSYGFLNKKTVAQLLFEFFEFFSRRFDYRTMEVSAINGRIQERLSLQNGKKQQIETAISDFAAQNRGISPTCVFDSKRKLWLSAAEQAYFKDLEEHGGMPSGMVPIPGVASASLTLNPVKPVAPPRGGHYDRFGNEAFLCVADPFIVSRNVAGACRGDRLAKVWRCFDHAYKCLGQGNITEAFQPLDLGGH